MIETLFQGSKGFNIKEKLGKIQKKLKVKGGDGSTEEIIKAVKKTEKILFNCEVSDREALSLYRSRYEKNQFLNTVFLIVNTVVNNRQAKLVRWVLKIVLSISLLQIMNI